MGNDLNLRATVILSIPPRNLEEISTCIVFNAPEDFPTPRKPLGPFITTKDITLSDGERDLLSKDPKYSLVYPPTKMKIATEVERMNSKIRYDNKPSSVNKKEEVINKLPRITDEKGIPIDWNGKKVKNDSDSPSIDGVEDTLAELFNECKNRYVFNPVEKSIDFSGRRATDYKMNRNVHLPKPTDNDRELQC